MEEWMALCAWREGLRQGQPLSLQCHMNQIVPVACSGGGCYREDWDYAGCYTDPSGARAYWRSRRAGCSLTVSDWGQCLAAAAPEGCSADPWPPECIHLECLPADAGNADAGT